MNFTKDSTGIVTASGTAQEMDGLAKLIAEHFDPGDSMAEGITDAIDSGAQSLQIRVDDPAIVADLLRTEGDEEQQADGDALANVLGTDDAG